MSNKMKLLMAVVLAAFSATSMAVPSTPSPTVVSGDTCGAPDRTATLTGASKCAYDEGINFGVADIQAIYPTDPWVAAGELTGDGSNGFLKATADQGWGNIPNGGEWSISSTFWTMYDEAVITMHIGQGNGDPDAWAWLITPDTLSGDWSLEFVAGGSTKGGGLSNLKLWGRGDGTTVPEPGIVALLATGLLLMGVIRRKTTV